MKKLPEEITSALLDLIEQKSFSDLTENEREWVLQWLAKEEYEAFRLAPSEFRISFGHDRAKIGPSISVKQSLLQQALQPKESTKGSWWVIPVPLYQLAMGVVLLLVLNAVWLRSISPSGRVTETPRDTIYQVVEKVQQIIQKDTVIRVMYAKEKLTETKVETPIPSTPSFEMLSLGYSSSPNFDSSHTSSATLSEDSGLTRFSVKTF